MAHANGWAGTPRQQEPLITARGVDLGLSDEKQQTAPRLASNRVLPLPGSTEHFNLQQGKASDTLGQLEEPKFVSISPMKPSPDTPALMRAPSRRGGIENQMSTRMNSGGPLFSHAGSMHGSWHERPPWWTRAYNSIFCCSLSGSRKLIIMPEDPRYLRWWYFTMGVVLITATLDPFKLSFVDTAGMFPYNDFWSVTDYISTTIFAIDMLFKFFLAFVDAEEGMVTCRRRIVFRYLRFLFWVDLVTTVPLDGIVSAALHLEHRSDNNNLGVWVALVRWIKLGRMYRIFDLFAHLEHEMIVSQISLILIRNNIYIFYVTHWMACLFYFTAVAEQFDESSWVGRNYFRWDGQGTVVRYIYSLYFSVTVFSGLGDQDFYVASPAESVIMIIFLLLNVVLQAYILGTITLIMVKADEKSKSYRERMEVLKSYSAINDLPKTLIEAMREHVELQFHHEQTSDENVLGIYPATIRRKVLRHLYLDTVRSCYLFKGSKARFLDQLLAAARIELYMPQMSLLSEGDIVSELYIIVDGEVSSCAGIKAAELDVLRRMSVSIAGGGSSLGGGREGGVDQSMAKSFLQATGRRKSIQLPEHSALREGSTLETQPSMKSARFKRGLTDNASTLGSESMFITDGMRAPSARRMSFMPHGDPSGFHFNTYGPSQPFGEVSFITEAPSPEHCWTTAVTRVLVLSKQSYDQLTTHFITVARSILNNIKLHAEEKLLDEVGEAALSADMDLDVVEVVRDAIAGGHSFSAAAAKAKAAAAASRAESQNLDGLVRSKSGGSDGSNKRRSVDVAAEAAALMSELKQKLGKAQAARLEQLEMVRNLVNSYARKQEAMRTYEFLLAAAAGDLQGLRNLIAQGVKPDAGDYDKRTALMVAAHEGHDSVIHLLLDEGADPNAKDTFGSTALQEALKAGHDSAMALLQEQGAQLGMEEFLVCSTMCQNIIDGDMTMLRRLVSAGANPNTCDYDGRCPLHIAAAEGNIGAVQLLVEEGGASVDVEDRWGHTPLDDAKDSGHELIIAYLEPRVQAAKMAKAAGLQGASGQDVKGFTGAAGASAAMAAGLAPPSPFMNQSTSGSGTPNSGVGGRTVKRNISSRPQRGPPLRGSSRANILNGGGAAPVSSYKAMALTTRESQLSANLELGDSDEDSSTGRHYKGGTKEKGPTAESVAPPGNTAGGIKALKPQLGVSQVQEDLLGPTYSGSPGGVKSVPNRAVSWGQDQLQEAEEGRHVGPQGSTHAARAGSTLPGSDTVPPAPDSPAHQWPALEPGNAGTTAGRPGAVPPLDLGALQVKTAHSSQGRPAQQQDVPGAGSPPSGGGAPPMPASVAMLASGSGVMASPMPSISRSGSGSQVILTQQVAGPGSPGGVLNASSNPGERKTLGDILEEAEGVVEEEQLGNIRVLSTGTGVAIEDSAWSSSRSSGPPTSTGTPQQHAQGSPVGPAAGEQAPQARTVRSASQGGAGSSTAAAGAPSTGHELATRLLPEGASHLETLRAGTASPSMGARARHAAAAAAAAAASASTGGHQPTPGGPSQQSHTAAWAAAGPDVSAVAASSSANGRASTGSTSAGGGASASPPVPGSVSSPQLLHGSDPAPVSPALAHLAPPAPAPGSSQPPTQRGIRSSAQDSKLQASEVMAEELNDLLQRLDSSPVPPDVAEEDGVSSALRQQAPQQAGALLGSSRVIKGSMTVAEDGSLVVNNNSSSTG